MTIELEPEAPMRSYQTYIEALERMHGWLETDLVHNCFLMGEEVGELFKAIRNHTRYCIEPSADSRVEPGLAASKAAVAAEIVDVFNYLLALANRLDIDLETAFRDKNERNQRRSWK